MKKFDQFLSAYLEAAAWADCPEENISESLEFDESSKKLAKKDCKTFFKENSQYFEENIIQAGHDFWLTRRGHGSGFWDRPEIYGNEAVKILTESSKKFNEGIYVEAIGRGSNRRLTFF